MTFCIGPSLTRIGTSCAPNATRRVCIKITMRNAISSPPPGQRSMLVVRAAMGKAHDTSSGRSVGKAGGRSGRTGIRQRDLLCGSTNEATSPGRTIRVPAIRSAASRRRRYAKRSKPADCATRAGVSSPRIGSLDNGYQTRTWFQHSARDFIPLMGRCLTRSTITARSSRARCSRRVSPAAIVTIRTAPD